MPATDTTSVHKLFTSAFVLDQPKLSRIMDILEQRYKETDIGFSPRIEVTFANDRKITTPSLEELFSLDNTVKNPIKSVIIRGADIEPEKLAVTLVYTAKERNNIELVVLSGNSKYASQVFAELEEQVERTFKTGWLYKITATQMIYMVMALIFVGAMLVLIVSNDNNVAKGSSFMLSLDEMNNFNSQAKVISTHEQKIDWLFNLQQRQLERGLTRHSAEVIRLGNPLTLKRLFIGLPILVALISFFYLFGNYYPHAVFLWGDIQEHYARLLSTRKMIWSVVIGSLLIGILSNLFSLGIASSIQ